MSSPPAAVPPDDVPADALPEPGARSVRPVRVPGPGRRGLPLRQAGLRVPHRLRPHVGAEDLEREWNLPALTRRDANANDLFDMVDLEARPAFARPPKLRAPANPARTQSCLVTGPGTIPPRAAVEVGAVPGTPVIGPAGLPAGVVGRPYQATLSATSVGRSARWSVLSDDLPAGLVLDKRHGTISGVPTSAGNSGVTIGVSQGEGPVGARGYTVVVTAT